MGGWVEEEDDIIIHNKAMFVDYSDIVGNTALKINLIPKLKNSTPRRG